MAENNIFLQAIRNKLRFENNGLISTEDLFDLSLLALNRIAVAVDAKLKTQQVSFLNNATVKKSDDSLRLEILVEVIRMKEEEAAAEKEAKARKELQQRALEIKASRKAQALLEMPDADLDKIIAGDF